eukprot:219343-Chlamydomonas_euryale.AAC.2
MATCTKDSICLGRAWQPAPGRACAWVVHGHLHQGEHLSGSCMATCTRESICMGRAWQPAQKQREVLSTATCATLAPCSLSGSPDPAAGL